MHEHPVPMSMPCTAAMGTPSGVVVDGADVDANAADNDNDVAADAADGAAARDGNNEDGDNNSGAAVIDDAVAVDNAAAVGGPFDASGATCDAVAPATVASSDADVFSGAITSGSEMRSSIQCR
jgi:hypothetical protein